MNNSTAGSKNIFSGFDALNFWTLKHVFKVYVWTMIYIHYVYESSKYLKWTILLKLEYCYDTTPSRNKRPVSGHRSLLRWFQLVFQNDIHLLLESVRCLYTFYFLIYTNRFFSYSNWFKNLGQTMFKHQFQTHCLPLVSAGVRAVGYLQAAMCCVAQVLLASDWNPMAWVHVR